MNKTKLDYTNVKIETGLPIPSLRHFRGRMKFRKNSLSGLLSKLEKGQSVFLNVPRSKIAQFAQLVYLAKKRLNFNFTVRNYYSVGDTHKGTRVWRVA